MIERGREAADVAAAATAVVITKNVAVTVPTAAVTCLKTLLFQNLVSIAILKFVQPFWKLQLYFAALEFGQEWQSKRLQIDLNTIL